MLYSTAKPVFSPLAKTLILTAFVVGTTVGSGLAIPGTMGIIGNLTQNVFTSMGQTLSLYGSISMASVGGALIGSSFLLLSFFIIRSVIDHLTRKEANFISMPVPQQGKRSTDTMVKPINSKDEMVTYAFYLKEGFAYSENKVYTRILCLNEGGENSYYALIFLPKQRRTIFVPDTTEDGFLDDRDTEGNAYDNDMETREGMKTGKTKAREAMNNQMIGENTMEFIVAPDPVSTTNS